MKDAKRRMLGLGLFVALALPWGATGAAAGAETPAGEIKKVEDAIRVVEEMMKEADKSIPQSLLEKSAGIAVIPDVIEAAYIVGGRHGSGVVCLRQKGGAWSDPVFVAITGGSVGFQAGVESTDIILVFRTARSIENFAKGKFTLGADVGVAAGPLGRSAEASTDAELKAEIYSYSRSRGLYVGLSLHGASISVGAKANRRFYGGKDVDPQAIFDGKAGPAPEIAVKLRQSLEKFSKPAK